MAGSAAESTRLAQGSFVRLAWVERGAWAVADQGLFAVANFGLGVLLARWLTPAEFGAFTVVYAIFLLLGTLHTAVLTEPMLVFGSARYAGAFRSYLRLLLKGHWLVTLGASALLAAAAAVVMLIGGGTGGDVAMALLGMAFAAPFILFSWLTRRACFARMQPRSAAIGGAIYLALMLIGTFVLHRSGRLGVLTALGVLALASLIAGAWIVWRLHANDSSRTTAPVDPRSVLAEHWRYGRWAIASSALSWVPGNVFFLALPAAGGLAASAGLKALLNLVMPILHANAALATLLLPALARARDGEQGRFRELAFGAAAVFAVGALLYWLLIGLVAHPLIAWLYDGKYVEFAGLLWLAGILPLTAGIVAVLGASLRALERPDLVFWAYVGSAAVALSAGVGSMWLWGVAGAIVGMLIASVTTAVILLVALRRQLTPT